jgi:hypothetical protein
MHQPQPKKDTQTAQIMGLGIVFLAIPLILIIGRHPDVNSAEFWMCRIIASLGAAAIGGSLPGLVSIDRAGIKATGAVALFVIVFFATPTIPARTDGPAFIPGDIRCSKACKDCRIVNDRPICSSCEARVVEDHYSLPVPGQTALNTICENMPKGDYKITVSGGVFPDFRTQGGAKCGIDEPNNRIDWNVKMSAVVDDGGAPKSLDYLAMGILTEHRSVSMEGTGTVPDSGRVSAHVTASDVWCWPDKHGNLLGIMKDFTLSIEAQSSSGQAGR